MSHRTGSLARHATAWTAMAAALLGGSAWAEAPDRITRAEAPRSVETPVAANSSPMSPALPIRIIRPNADLEIAFDARTRNAVYVLEKLDRKGQNLGKGHKRPSFYEEKNIQQESFRSKLSHYKNSGYDRGHLAPAADFPQRTHDTYNLCNVSPQNPAMNKGIWSQIEDFCRRLADREDRDTYVVTGPVWLPTTRVAEAKFQYAHLGLGKPPSLVAVPTHFFKVVVVVSGNSVRKFACFVVPNREPNKTKTMADYVVPWTDLEAVTGLRFFPRLVTDEWKASSDHLTHETVLRFTSSQKLLTDGSTGSGSSSKRGFGRRSLAPEHLCKNGDCR